VGDTIVCGGAPCEAERCAFSFWEHAATPNKMQSNAIRLDNAPP
jgi:hypothetical protein